MKQTRKGIILAGGAGTRLLPLTTTFSKQLLPIFDKPMIYYPLSTIMLAGIREVLLITTERDQPFFKELLRNGSHLGLEISYKVQDHPRGLAEAYILADEFLNGDPSLMILGDNLFYGNGFVKQLENANSKLDEATIFTHEVFDPQRFGVATIDENHKVLNIIEKPDAPESNLAITGLYFLDGDAPARAQKINPSKRGELEIIDLLQTYLNEDNLNAQVLNRGYTWLDAGTFESLIEASSFIQFIQKKQQKKISCIEEIAFRNGWISKKDLSAIGNNLGKNSYGDYIRNLAN